MESGIIENQQRDRAYGSEKIELREGDIGLGVVAREPIARGEVLVALAHVFVDQRAQHTIQIDERHQAGTREIDDYLNHSCDPSAALDTERLCFVAARDIAPGEAVTFNYNSSEYDIAEPFACGCGSPRCEGTIRGFRHLTPRQRAEIRPLLAAHLLAMTGADDVIDPGCAPA